MGTNITTAVDSLVRFVNRKGKIELETASKDLGIPANILGEWATFLDQEKIIKLEYKFTTPYLISTKKGKEETEDIIVDYDIILRKLQSMQAYLIRSEPKENKQVSEKEYLLKEISKIIINITKKKVTQDNTEEIKKLSDFYNKYKEAMKKQDLGKNIIIKKLEEMYDFVKKSRPKTVKKAKQREYLIKEINRLLETREIQKEKIKKLVRYYNIYKRG